MQQIVFLPEQTAERAAQAILPCKDATQGRSLHPTRSPLPPTACETWIRPVIHSGQRDNTGPPRRSSRVDHPPHRCLKRRLNGEKRHLRPEDRHPPGEMLCFWKENKNEIVTTVTPSGDWLDQSLPAESHGGPAINRFDFVSWRASTSDYPSSSCRCLHNHVILIRNDSSPSGPSHSWDAFRRYSGRTRRCRSRRSR